MALTPKIAERIVGWWRIEGAETLGDGLCCGLDVRGESYRGPSLVPELVRWKPGRLGCDTSSSSLMRIELAEERGATGADLVLTGRAPRHAPDSWVDARLALTIGEEGGTDLRGVMTIDGDSGEVRLSPSEVDPPFDLVSEP
jgi:hypothetical protein